MADFISKTQSQTLQKLPSSLRPKTPMTGTAFCWTHQVKPTDLSSTSRTRIVTTTRDNTISSNNNNQEKINPILKLFRDRCAEIQSSKEGRSRVDLKSLKVLKEFKEERKLSGPTMANVKSTGSIPGVKIGDRFNYRTELIIVSIHRKLQQGIDYTTLFGKRVATCVVARVHHDNMTNPNFLIYEGEWGICGGKGKKKKGDQVMKRGNLALKNSVEVKNEVRVVKGVKDRIASKVVYVYDGLYQVVKCARKRGTEGYMVFEFEMKRIPGPATVNWKLDYNLV